MGASTDFGVFLSCEISLPWALWTQLHLFNSEQLSHFSWFLLAYISNWNLFQGSELEQLQGHFSCFSHLKNHSLSVPDIQHLEKCFVYLLPSFPPFFTLSFFICLLSFPSFFHSLLLFQVRGQVQSMLFCLSQRQVLQLFHDNFNKMIRIFFGLGFFLVLIAFPQSVNYIQMIGTYFPANNSLLIYPKPES